MKGKTVVITGATSGIGEIAAQELAEMGARIVLVARSAAHAEVTLARLRERGGAVRHAAYYADLARLAGVKRVAAEIAACEPRIDVLINNAGAFFSQRQVTEDGLECTFALNHMAYFMLTEGLRARLAATAPARIVNTASGTHHRAVLDLDDLQSRKSYSGRKAYSLSKLCNVLFTRELAKRVQRIGVTANCLHPGFVATRFGDQNGGLTSLCIRLAKLFAIPPEQGAKTIVHLASSPEVAGISGRYFVDCKVTAPSPLALDDRAASVLWERTAALAGMQPYRD